MVLERQVIAVCCIIVSKFIKVLGFYVWAVLFFCILTSMTLYWKYPAIHIKGSRSDCLYGKQGKYLKLLRYQ